MNVWPGYPCANVANNSVVVARCRGKTSLLVFYDVFCTKTINCYYYSQSYIIYEIFLNMCDVNQPSSFPRIIFNTRLLTIHFTICSLYIGPFPYTNKTTRIPYIVWYIVLSKYYHWNNFINVQNIVWNTIPIKIIQCRFQWNALKMLFRILSIEPKHSEVNFV